MRWVGVVSTATGLSPVAVGGLNHPGFGSPEARVLESGSAAGILPSVVGGFELGRWDMANGLEEPPVVEPVGGDPGDVDSAGRRVVPSACFNLPRRALTGGSGPGAA